MIPFCSSTLRTILAFFAFSCLLSLSQATSPTNLLNPPIEFIDSQFIDSSKQDPRPHLVPVDMNENEARIWKQQMVRRLGQLINKSSIAKIPQDGNLLRAHDPNTLTTVHEQLRSRKYSNHLINIGLKREGLMYGFPLKTPRTSFWRSRPLQIALLTVPYRQRYDESFHPKVMYFLGIMDVPMPSHSRVFGALDRHVRGSVPMTHSLDDVLKSLVPHIRK